MFSLKKIPTAAMATIGLLAGMTAANAADLGGNCCADLEERIAELEATTARKGNRKVSLTVSGWVSQQVTFWDDGIESNAYVSDIGTTLASNFKLTGSARITPDLSAGYVLQVEVIGNEPLNLSQNVSASGKGVGVLQSFWFLKSESLGKLSVGTQSSAADNAAILVDGSGSLVPANYVLFDNNSFALVARNAAGNLRRLSNATWGALATCPGLQIGVAADCDGVPNNNVRYDTPVFAGFSASASWGEDDIWAVAGRYAGEFSGFKLAAAIAYTESTNQSTVAPTGIFRRDAAALQVGAYIQHIPTGLFVYGAYGRDYNDGLLSPAEVAALGKKPDGDNWYIKAGLRQKWSSLGHTVVFGEYGENNDKQSIALNSSFGFVNGSNITQWGAGVVQEIDAAAMSMWVVYRHFDADMNCRQVDGNPTLSCGSGFSVGKNSLEGIDILKVGVMINF